MPETPETSDRFQVVGDSLIGRGLSFDVGALGVLGEKSTPARLDALVDLAEVVYSKGRDSVRLPHDDRFDLFCAVEALRALAVIVGPLATGDRYRRSADIIARLLHDQEAGA